VFFLILQTNLKAQQCQGLDQWIKKLVQLERLIYKLQLDDDVLVQFDTSIQGQMLDFKVAE
jgi:hypothetical protein